MFDDPELELRVVDEGDGGFGRGCDLVIAALEINGVVVVDTALLAQGKVEVEQGLWGCGAEALGAGEQGVFPDGEGMRPVLRWRVRFWRWSSIWRISSACSWVVTLAWARRVTRRR